MMIEYGETPAEKWLREQRRHKDLLAMTDKRQIVGPVLKPEAPASREGEQWARHEACSDPWCVLCALRERDTKVLALEDDFAREREAHAVTRLSERLYQESLAQAQGEVRTAEAAL